MAVAGAEQNFGKRKTLPRRAQTGPTQSARNSLQVHRNSFDLSLQYSESRKHPAMAAKTGILVAAAFVFQAGDRYVRKLFAVLEYGGAG
jgi:hypothetical protein